MTSTGEPRAEAQEVDLEDIVIRLESAGSRMIRSASQMRPTDAPAFKVRAFVHSTGAYLRATARFVSAQQTAGFLEPDEIARLTEVQSDMADVFLEHGPPSLQGRTKEALT